MEKVKTFWTYCTCCGGYFDSPIKRQHEDSEVYCERCETDLQERENAQADKLVETLKSGLNDKNKEKLASYDIELQRSIAWQAVVEGQITFSFGAKK